MKGIVRSALPCLSLDHTKSHKTHPISLACQGGRDESRQHSRAAQTGSFGVLVLTCPRTEQLMLCVVATSTRVDDAYLETRQEQQMMVPHSLKLFGFCQRKKSMMRVTEGKSIHISAIAGHTPRDQQRTWFSLSLPGINQF